MSSRPLRVGLNLTYIVGETGGSTTYARELIPRLLEAEPELELTAYIANLAPESLTRHEWAGELRWVRLPSWRFTYHMWHELAGMGIDARRRRLDVVHGLANVAPVLHPGVASVATILDVIWMHRPEALELAARLVQRTLTPMVGRAATRIIAISNAARDDISQTLSLDPAKFDVTSLGVTVPPAREPDPDLRSRLGIGPEPFLLCVAARRPHKNVNGLIRALALLDEPRPQLVLPGPHNVYEDELLGLAEELGVAAEVRFPGWVGDEDLDGLYRQAACFALPSFEEGFGLPVLEAMARDTPVVCSDIAVFAEVAGDAAVLCDPADPASIAGAIAGVLGDRDRAHELVERGRQRCRTFTWERTAAATLDSYRRAVGR